MVGIIDAWKGVRADRDDQLATTAEKCPIYPAVASDKIIVRARTSLDIVLDILNRSRNEPVGSDQVIGGPRAMLNIADYVVESARSPAISADEVIVVTETSVWPADAVGNAFSQFTLSQPRGGTTRCRIGLATCLGHAFHWVLDEWGRTSATL